MQEFEPEELRRRLEQTEFLSLGESADLAYEQLDDQWARRLEFDHKTYVRVIEWNLAVLLTECPVCGAGKRLPCINQRHNITRFPPHEKRITETERA
jgi:hypothetical protein